MKLNSVQSQALQKLYKDLDESLGSRSSAKVVVPLILEMIQAQSVIDVGCGVGSWLAVFKEFGVQDILGVDLDRIDKKFLQIPEEQFFPWNLTKPFKMNRRFDIVVCLEAAAYLPSECAPMLVDSLTELGPVVLFSSAVPFQDKAQFQLNQQWPEYWATYFQKKEYMVIDCLRRKIWNNPKVNWWFAQNILLFIRQDYLESHKLLKREFDNTYTSQLSIVHPEMYLDQKSFMSLLSQLPISFKNALKKRIGG